MTPQPLKPPETLTVFIEARLQKNGSGGRPHFLCELAKTYDVANEVLNILELAWIQNRSPRLIARRYKTGKDTIYRLLEDLKPFRAEIVTFLQEAPRRKQFYNRKLDTSDYETVANYIRRAKRDELKRYARFIMTARRCWKALGYKDPKNWKADEVDQFLKTLPRVMQSKMLDAVRVIAPQIADNKSSEYIGTGRFREKIGRRKKDIFGKELMLINKVLIAKGLEYERLIFEVHVTTGAREGTDSKESGLCGLNWGRFKKNFTIVDLYESKVRGGIWWRGCPVDLFFPDLPARLRDLWKNRGKPQPDAKLIIGGYHELRRIYKTIRETMLEHCQGKLEPSLTQEFATLKPHDADKIHCNLLWEAKVPLEVVAGEHLGKSDGIGLMGRGWLDINTIKKHYLALTAHSERIKEIRRQVKTYSRTLDKTKSAYVA